MEYWGGGLLLDGGYRRGNTCFAKHDKMRTRRTSVVPIFLKPLENNYICEIHGAQGFPIFIFSKGKFGHWKFLS